MEIIPAILTSDPEEARVLLEKSQTIAKRAQIDIIDDVFAPNRTVDPSIFADIDTRLLLDYQLMVKEPVKWIEKSFFGQADRIIGHIEMMSNQQDFIGKVQELGTGVGLAVDLKTPLTTLDPAIIGDTDVILLMSVPAGFGGQEFNPAVLTKVQDLVKLRNQVGGRFKICVDGGINADNIRDVLLSGADEVAIGRSLLSNDIESNILKLRDIIK